MDVAASHRFATSAAVGDRILSLRVAYKRGAVCCWASATAPDDRPAQARLGRSNFAVKRLTPGLDTTVHSERYKQARLHMPVWWRAGYCLIEQAERHLAFWTSSRLGTQSFCWDSADMGGIQLRQKGLQTFMGERFAGGWTLEPFGLGSGGFSQERHCCHFWLLRLQKREMHRYQGFDSTADLLQTSQQVHSSSCNGLEVETEPDWILVSPTDSSDFWQVHGRLRAL